MLPIPEILQKLWYATDSFIVSVTRYEDIWDSFGRGQRSEIEGYRGILFQEDKNYIEKIIGTTINNKY